MKKYVPENIDIAKLIRSCPVNQINDFHPDKLIWILSEIAEKPIASSGYAEIHSKRFKSFVHNYKDYIQCLDATGIIEQDLSFSHVIVSKVRGYKYSDQYSSTIKGIEIDYLPIVKRSSKDKDIKLKTCKGNKHLIKWFNPGLTIDYDLAIDYLATYYSEKKKEQELLAHREETIRNTWYEDYQLNTLSCRVAKPKIHMMLIRGHS